MKFQRKYKEPWLAILFSLILPGAGHLFTASYKKATLYLFSYVIYLISSFYVILNEHIRITGFFYIGILFLWIFWVFVIIDSYNVAKIHNIGCSINPQKKKSIMTLSIILMLFILLFGDEMIYQKRLIKSNILEGYRIASDTMSPTLIINDRFFVKKYAYSNSLPERGDIVAFKKNKAPKKVFVKRIIGLPNEALEIKNNKIYIDGKILQTPTKRYQNKYYNAGEFGKEGESIYIPSGEYYVMGDNSQISRDSRYFGTISRDQILGKAYKIYWPISRSKLLQRK